MIRRLRRLLCLAAVVVAPAACGTNDSSPAAGNFTPHVRGVLTVATTVVPSPGFWEGTATHPTGGLEYELAKDLAQRFGLKSVRIVPDGPMRIYDNTDEMLSALRTGKVDAVLLDMPLAVLTARRSHGRLRAAAQLPRHETIAAALPKGSTNFDAVDSAMRAFAADGTLEHLLRVWVGQAAADAESSIPLLHTTL